MIKTIKLSIFVMAALLCVSLCFAVPNPGGKASISYSVPSSSTPPAPTYVSSSISKPYPTNKFFNSLIYNQYQNYSLNMYTYPQVFRAESSGMLLEFPKTAYMADKINYGDGETDADQYPNTMVISVSTTTANGYNKSFSSAILEGYSDFAATAKWESGGYWMTSTMVQGSPFSYYEFSDGLLPSINFPYDWTEGNYWSGSAPAYTLYYADGTEVSASTLTTDATDRIILRVHLSNKDVYYGIFVPSGTTFSQDSKDINTYGWYVPWIRIAASVPSGSNYMSVALLPSTNLSEAVTDLATYYKYAYNFVSDTKVNWSVASDYSSTTTFNFTITKKRTDVSGQQDGTIFCLYPHQYNNLKSSVNYISGKTFATLRGTMKLACGTSFTTKTNFYGMVPYFTYDVSDISGDLTGYLSSDVSSINVSEVSANPYRAGKVVAKLANMLPIADNLDNSTIKKSIIIKLRTLLKEWFTYYSSKFETGKYFAYDNIWGGLEGIKDNEFYSFNYNDHHFHFGYFIYAAAFLSMYDEEFMSDYGGMVNLLIKDIANTVRNDGDFPYMRHFDFYESHSWANGMGGADNRGIDQESSSEAMNAWSAIFLWGLVSDNDTYKKLGAYLYSNEYQSIKYYYFDIDGEILKSPYNHNSVGRLFGGLVSYDLYFYPLYPQTIKGIQILPMTPTMTYLAYDKTYLNSFYTAMLSESSSAPYQWWDIWTRLIALASPSTALDYFNTYKENDAEDGSSRSFTYHFMKFFEKYGTPDFSYTADFPSYMVLTTGSGLSSVAAQKVSGTTKVSYSAYNPSSSNKTVRFYKDGKNVGSLNVAAKSFAITSDLIQNDDGKTLAVFPIPYKPNSSGKYGGKGITFLNLEPNSTIKIFNIAGEKVFETTTDSESNFYLWKTKNEAGNNVASGVYIYYIKSGGNVKKGKLAIER